MRKPKVAPSFHHYLESIGIGRDQLATVLVGHLVVEALLVELIQILDPGEHAWRWSFPVKVSCCVDAGYLSGEQGVALRELNDIRNDFCHSLGHLLDFDRAFAFVQVAANAGFDFSDESIFRDKQSSREWYGTEGIITEVLNAFYFHLSFVLLDHGGPDRTGG